MKERTFGNLLFVSIAYRAQLLRLHPQAQSWKTVPLEAMKEFSGVLVSVDVFYFLLFLEKRLAHLTLPFRGLLRRGWITLLASASEGATLVRVATSS